ncbi:MAG: ABC transporter substrate-binding protein [Verrucomicrobia bacterium]|nr:ABC transporter substrate-binding protein [Verrucomicrobiota bacterium]
MPTDCLYLILAVLMLAGLDKIAFAQGEVAGAGLSKVRVALQWLPQSQFAGYYMARDKGFYREAGLDVELIHTGPGPSALDYLAQDKADFATLFLTDAIAYARDPVPLANVAQFVRRSNLMLVAWKDMGIEKPADLNGRRVSHWQGTFSIAFTAFFRQHDIQPEILPQHHSVNLFLRRGVTTCSAMLYNEYHRIYQAGIDYDKLTLFKMRDYGLGFPEDGLYTTAERLERNPKQCLALRRATIEGWDYARRYPEEVIDAVLREAHRSGVPANRPHSQWMLEHILESIFPPDYKGEPGRLDEETYRDTVDSLKAAEMIQSAPAFEEFAPIETLEAP